MAAWSLFCLCDYMLLFPPCPLTNRAADKGSLQGIQVKPHIVLPCVYPLQDNSFPGCANTKNPLISEQPSLPAGRD
jgi:hypothetical protein